MPAFQRHIDAAKRHRRLAAAHVPLQQSVHARGGSEIGKDLVDRPLLPVRKFEAETGGKFLDFRRRHPVFMNAHVLLAPLDDPEGGDQNKILFEREPFGGGVAGVHIGRIVDVVKALRQGREGVFFRQGRRDHAVDMHLFQGLRNGVPHDLLGQSPFERIHGHDALQSLVFVQRLERGIDHGDLPVLVLHPPVKEIFARLDALPHIRLIEPDRHKGQPVLIAVHLHRFQAGHVIDGRDFHHFARRQHHVVMVSGTERGALGQVEIGARIKADEILRLKNAEFIEILFPLFADRSYRRQFHIPSFSAPFRALSGRFPPFPDALEFCVRQIPAPSVCRSGFPFFRPPPEGKRTFRKKTKRKFRRRRSSRSFVLCTPLLCGKKHKFQFIRLSALYLRTIPISFLYCAPSKLILATLP